MRTVVDGAKEEDEEVEEEEEGTVRTEGVSTTGKAEVKIWVLEAEMRVIVVVEVEVQVVVTYLVAAWVEVVRRRRRGRRRVGGWRIFFVSERVWVSSLCCFARERFGGARLCSFEVRCFSLCARDEDGGVCAVGY